MQKGFAPIFLVVALAVIGILFGSYFLAQSKSAKISSVQNSDRTISQSPRPTENLVSSQPSSFSHPSPNPQNISPQVKTMLIQYIPPGGVATVYSGAIDDTVDFVKNKVMSALTNGTKFNGYSNPAANSVLNYTLSDDDIHTEYNVPPTRADNYLGFPPKADNQPGYLDLPSIFRKYNVCTVAKQKDIKFVTLVMADYGIYAPKGFEDYITGSQGIPTNGPILKGSDYCVDKTIMLSTFVYTRGLGEALHSYGHSLEGIFSHFKEEEYYKWSDSNSCGTVHNPPNSKSEYDYSNTINSQSDCKTWRSDDSGQKESLNCSAWGCTQDGWLVWWMQNMPADWWTYLENLDK